MVVTDPIADMLTRIRNALVARHATVDIPASNMKKSLANILLAEGFIKDVELVSDNIQGTIRVTLKYGANNQKVISGLKKISTPGLRVYCRSDELPKVLGGMGIAVISTSKGVITDKEARRLGVGGEVLAYIW